MAQNEIRAKSGQPAVLGLAAQKKKVSFLERLANVGRSRKETAEEVPAKREPEFRRASGEVPAKREPEFGRASGEVPAKREPEFGRASGEMPKAPPRLEPDSPAAAPRGIRIERPRHEHAVPAVPKLVEARASSVAVESLEQDDESSVDDDLEIPAFLRRRAN
ncbi:MAG: hypothetical protein H7X78_02865 [Methyloceanibacter sp.]|nr:hypothetical protein [Methyloceanibacter sp.]